VDISNDINIAPLIIQLGTFYDFSGFRYISKELKKNPILCEYAMKLLDEDYYECGCWANKDVDY